jgi:hypothetical protein
MPPPGLTRFRTEPDRMPAAQVLSTTRCGLALPTASCPPLSAIESRPWQIGWELEQIVHEEEMLGKRRHKLIVRDVLAPVGRD